MRTVMQLHRASAKSDWHNVTPNERNQWQKIAARTQGLVTPGNLITFVGAAMVIAGLIMLADRVSIGALLLVAAGRLADIADGLVADKTGTKSSLGEAFDAAADKILALVAILIIFAADLAPILVLLLIALQGVINSSVSLYGKSKGRTVHPVASGKLAAVTLWLSLLLFIIGSEYGSIYQTAGWAVIALFGILMIVSTRSYVTQARGHNG